MPPNYSGGYFLVRGAQPKQNREILPPVVWTPSDYVCNRYPYTWCDPDFNTPSGEIDEALKDLGLDSTDLPAVRAWVTFEEERGRLGCFGVFMDLEVAKDFARMFLRKPDPFKLLGIGLPEEFVQLFLRETTEWYRGHPICGVFQAVARRSPIADGGVSLGYEPLGYEPVTAPGLRNHISEERTVRLASQHLNEHGRFADLRTCIWAVEAEEEQAVWSPWLIVEYPIVESSFARPETT